MKFSKKTERYLTWFFAIIAVVLLLIVIYEAIYKKNMKYFEFFSNPPTLRYVFMQSCGHCLKFNDTWDQLKQEVEKNSINIKLEKLDLQAEENKDKVQGVSGAPTLLYIDPSNKSEEYKGERTLGDIIAFLKLKASA